MAAVILVAVALLLWRFGFLAVFPYDLHGDEAQYWTWAQAIDWGYYSKPPVIAWLIAASTAICGDGLFCVKLTSPLLYAGTGLLIYAIASHLYGVKEALIAATLFLTLPAISLGSLVISTDAPLLFFWALGLLALIRALELKNGWGWWLVVGVAAGFGLLSKYNMSFFAVSAFLFLISSREHRHWLMRPQPWVGAVIAGLIYLPNFLWNVRSGFASYRHTHELSQVEQAQLSLQGLAEFIGAQFGVFGPLLFGVLIFLVVLGGVKWWREPRTRLLVAFFLPWFAMVLAISLLSRAHGNWAAPAYVSAVVLVSAWLAGPGRWRAILLWTSILLHLLLAATLQHYDRVVAPLVGIHDSTLDPFKRIRGWEFLGQEITRIQQDYPETPLLTQDRMLTAQLLYYVHPRMQPVIKWNPDGMVRDHYDITTTPEGREGRDFLLVREGTRFPDELRAYFDHVESVTTVRVPLYADNTRIYGVFLMQGFRGYSP